MPPSPLPFTMLLPSECFRVFLGRLCCLFSLQHLSFFWQKTKMSYHISLVNSNLHEVYTWTYSKDVAYFSERGFLKKDGEWKKALCAWIAWRGREQTAARRWSVSTAGYWARCQGVGRVFKPHNELRAFLIDSAATSIIMYDLATQWQVASVV